MKALDRPPGEVLRASPPRRRTMARPAGGDWARRPRRRRGSSPGSRRSLWLAFTAFSLAVLGAGWALPAFSAPPEASPRPAVGGGSPEAATPGPGATASATPAIGTAVSPSPSPRPPSGTPVASSHPAAPTASPSPAVSASPPRRPDAAPAGADEFDREGQVIEIGFPLKPSTRYRYRDNWADLRQGAAEHYNHAHSRRGSELRRAHDGIDLYARRGEPVLAPFEGLVVKPADLWQPWHPERYGRTAVIVSQEQTSEGYVALLSHLDRLWVEAGQLVRRGEVIGTVGSTGNAEGGRAHLHFELRAPFPLAWHEVGEERLVDAFNPYPSLLAADPRRQD